MCEICACGGLSIAGRFPYKSETGRNTSDSVVRLIEGLENVFAICSKNVECLLTFCTFWMYVSVLETCVSFYSVGVKCKKLI